MKSIMNYKIGIFLLMTFFFVACKQEVMDIDRTQEGIELTSSAPDIVLNDLQMTDTILTFNWKAARPVTDDYLVSYTTKLDVVGNNFGSSTSIMNYEDEGIFSRSFTAEQLQNWANEKWKIATNKPFTIQFRVIATFEGPGKFEAPEVRTVAVHVQPVKTLEFDADKIFLAGSAVPGMAPVEISKTLENENKYAYLLQLDAGELQIPVSFNGETNYICPANGERTVKDGEVVSVKMRQQPLSWNIETPGEYRVVLDMAKATATIYSPATALQPKTVLWNKDGVPTTTEVKALWMHGAINGWGDPVKMECQISLADPQILIYTGGRTGKSKFIVYGGTDNNKNLAYTFSCPLTASGTKQELALTLNKIAELSGGNSSAQRDSYYTIPAGTNMIVFDLRNHTILAKKH